MRAEDDPRWDLIRQLIEYKKFKEAAAHLQHSPWNRNGCLRAAGPVWRVIAAAPLPLGEVGIFQLINAFQTVHQTGRSPGRFAGNFRRTFHRLGQDRFDFAARVGVACR